MHISELYRSPHSGGTRRVTDFETSKSFASMRVLQLMLVCALPINYALLISRASKLLKPQVALRKTCRCAVPSARTARLPTGLLAHAADAETDYFVSLEPSGTEDSHPLAHRTYAISWANFKGRLADCFQRDRSVGRRRRSAATAASSSKESAAAVITKPSAFSDLARLATACKAEKPLMILSFIFLVAAALCEVSLPHYSSAAVNALLSSTTTAGSTAAATAAAAATSSDAFAAAVRGVAGFGLLAAVLTGARAVCFGLAGTRVVTRIRAALFRALLQQDPAFFDGAASGELAARLGSDCTKLGNVVAFHVNIMARQAIQLAAGTTLGLLSVAAIAQAHGAFNRHMAERTQLLQVAAVCGHTTVADTTVDIDSTALTASTTGVPLRLLLALPLVINYWHDYYHCYCCCYCYCHYHCFTALL
eukprot:16778-Heterococcus_DN1.PRE.3